MTVRKGLIEEERKERRREANRKYQQRRREQLTDQQRLEMRQNDAAMHRVRRNSQSEEEHRAILAARNERERQQRDNENENERRSRQISYAEIRERTRSQETEEQRQLRVSQVRESQIIRQQQISEVIRNNATNFNEASIETHDCGPLNVQCQYCKAYHFEKEKPSDGKFKSCCHKGKIKLERKDPFPTFLENLMTNQNDPFHHNYMDQIRSYNSALSFASMGATTVSIPGHGPYVFKVQGQVYHRTSHVEPINGETPKYAQLYVVDSAQATEQRMSSQGNGRCLPQLMQLLDAEIRKISRFANSYHMMQETMIKERDIAKSSGLDIPNVNMVFRRDRRADPRRFNSPTANEIAMVFVNEDGEPPFERDIRVYPKNPTNPNQQFLNLNILSPNLDPMTYALLFPYGEEGWEPKWKCESYIDNNARIRSFASMLQYKSALISIRDFFNPIISARKLYQQWIVDSYLQIAGNNLNYIRHQQSKLRADLYDGLADHIADQPGVPAGRRIILPSSFEGSPRNMRERCCDAMAIFGRFGPPDGFVTFTCNPNWKEIRDNLKPGEQPTDRPDLTSRVFRLKLKSLLELLVVHGVLGKVIAYAYTIEFQKRGLPHAHILLTLAEDDKPKTPEAIDRIVNAEIPDKATNPKLFDAVTKFMLHGPCGPICLENNQCKKKFPKEFCETTEINNRGYPRYRRRANIEVDVRNRKVDNRFVVPYNPYLLAKFDAHINVEICTSLKAVKYIYKYIYKGFDCANLAVYSGEVPAQGKDEITHFVSGRYVSPVEAAWRIFEFPMHDRSHAVYRLPIHLPNRQLVVFEEGQEELALDSANIRGTALTKYFELNRNDADARSFLYTEIPFHYVYEKGEWRKRKQGGNKIVPRMYTVSLADKERFYLRLLLLHVKGATCFEDVRTVNGVLHPTFQQAACERGLLESDLEWKRCLQEASIFQMPKHMRQTYAFILLYCAPESCLALWEEFRDEMSADFQRNSNADDSYNLALGEINNLLGDHGKKCEDFGLPTPSAILQSLDTIYNQDDELKEAERLISMLNAEQRKAFELITAAVDTDDVDHGKCFFLDGPGGSGKTHLYRTLMSFYRGRGQHVLPFATTGIAATLLKGGRTVHSGFKLPIPLNETSVSYIKHASREAENFRAASLIIIDEVTMLPKEGLRCIDAILRELLKVDKPFGGKVIVIGGDFRQTLPVVPHGSKVEIIETCIKSSPLWRHFRKVSLKTNMRSNGQNEFNNWLLEVGSGTSGAINGLSEGMIQIPADIVTSKSIVEAIYGKTVQHLSTDDLTKRVILASTNEICLNINKEIIRQLCGEERIYYSADSIVSEDPNDAVNYPTEFLNSLTLSGMPPHQLILKPGTIVMLMRNLAPKKGLCNGTRLMVKSLQRYSITAEILSECNRGDVIHIPRIDLAPSDVQLPFILKRRQFPIIPAFAVTINKSQGQTYDIVGLQLNEPVFSHGQLYVALSRSRNRNNIKVAITPGKQQGKLLNTAEVYTPNVVFKEIFENAN